jgi:zinc protease
MHPWRRLPAVALVSLALAVPAVAQSGTGATAEIDIPYEKFVLSNGLTLIVHEDHKAPIVAVNVWYHVGSKNERPGKTGFAHLFEHLMFNGSENFNDDWFKALVRVGATDLNGTTNPDRTNYFQNVPVEALDLVLWLESDRMGHLLGVIDQAQLDEQRGVVQNEKRQGENQPYGRVFITIAENTYPEGHPYSWSTIGSMEDLDAASLEDVQEWFQIYHGAANAVLVIAGDVDAQEVERKVEQYFGWIPSGPPIANQDEWIARMEGEHRQVMQDRVPQARIHKVWNVPAIGSADAEYLALVANVLASGKTSRLYKRLVYDEQIATDVSAFVFGREIGSQFMIIATAKPGQDLAAVERAINEELARFLENGPTAAELARVKTQTRAGFIRGIERIGGFGGKSDILAQGQVYRGDPAAYKTLLARTQAATAKNLLDAARAWLSDGVYVLAVRPFPEYAAASEQVDRASLPFPPSIAGAPFPRFERVELANGLDILLVERHGVPQVRLQLLVDAGYAGDQAAKPGTANLTMDMLDEGTATRDALDISEELLQLGATLSSGSNLDVSVVTMSALTENLDASLALFADVVLNPAFPQAELERLQLQTTARIEREMMDPNSMGLRVLPALLYDEGHAYAIPLTGTGTIESVRSMTREDLVGFHQTWFMPNNATLIVVGDITMAEIRPKLEQLFSRWQPGDVPEKSIGPVQRQDAPSIIYLMDRPGAQQSVIYAARVIPPKANEREIPFVVMNRILGGDFTSRINMNLREDKHWSYGSRTFFVDARGPRLYSVVAPVQTDRTRESMIEIRKELLGITGEWPVDEEELAKAQASLTLSLPGRWETAAAVTADLAEIVQYGLPDTHWSTYGDRVRETTVSDIVGTAQSIVAPDRVVWVVVGDREKIEPGIRELGFGEVRILDATGRVRSEVQAAASP